MSFRASSGYSAEVYQMICSQNFKDAYFSRMQKELRVIYIWYNKGTPIFSCTMRNSAAETKTAIQEIAFNRKSLLDLVRSPFIFESNQIAQQFIKISLLQLERLGHLMLLNLIIF